MSRRPKSEKKKRQKERKKRSKRALQLTGSLGGVKVLDFLGSGPPPGIENMSDVFEAFLEPYRHVWRNEDQLNKLFLIGMAAWNMAISPFEERSHVIRRLEEAIPPDCREDFRELVMDMIRRKETYFSHNKRVILKFAFQIEGDAINLQVVSTMPEPAVR
jgi:hypothetical protein